MAGRPLRRLKAPAVTPFADWLPPKPVYTKEYLASKGMKRNGALSRVTREGVRISRTPRTAPGGAWYGVIYQPRDGGGPGGYRASGAGARAILGPFEKKADIPTHLGQFSDGGFIRAVKLTSEMPNWMRKLPHLSSLVATVKKRRNPTTIFDKLVDALTERGVDFEVVDVFSVPTLTVFSASGSDQTMVQVFPNYQGEEEIVILGRSFQSAPVAALTLARIAALH